jgi:hypothetical protein
VESGLVVIRNPLWGKSRSRDFAIAQGALRGKIHAILEIAATKRELLIEQ